MKLYSAKIPVIVGEIVRILNVEGDIETSEAREVEDDLASVLKEYLRVERELTERAKDRVEAVKGSRNDLGRFKRSLAEEKGIGLGGEGTSWILNQMLQMLMRSPHVDEIFSTDDVMRRKMKGILERHMSVDDELDKDVRARIKNLQEGTQQWEVEYARVMDSLKKSRGLV